MDRFEEAVEWLTSKAKHFVRDGKLKTGDWHPLELILMRRFRIEWRRDNEDGPSYFGVPETCVHDLISLAQTELGAHLLATTVAATNISFDKPLPSALRFFAADILKGRAKPPRTSPGPPASWSEHFLLLAMAREAERKFGLHLTRNDEDELRRSACDAVVEAIVRAGCADPFTYGQVKERCVGTKFKKMREQYDSWISAKPRLGLLDPLT